MNVVALLGGVRATIFAGLALLALLFGGVQAFRLNSVQHQLESQKLALAKSAKDFAEWKIQAEANKAEAVAEIDKKHREEQKHVQDQANRVIADLRSDAIQLRKRFTCQTPGQPNSTDSAIGGVDAERIGGLTTEDAEFLLREAADSDRKSVKINALIDIIEEYLAKEK